MASLLRNFEIYLSETLGAQVATTPWRDGDRLPHLLRERYEFAVAQVLEAPLLLMIDRGEAEVPPAIVRKHMDLVREKWASDIVYVRAGVSAYHRKRLVEQRVPFVVPGNQMYLPMLGVDLREHFRRPRSDPARFSPSTQALLIHWLLNETEAPLTPAGIAHRLGYSAMTMTRAFDDCSALAEPDHAVVAVGREDWRAIQRHQPTRLVPALEPGATELEVWIYPPALHAEKGLVDPLSLYLSIKASGDERVEAALEEMMGRLKW
jgi:hypothetical protein